MEVLGGDGGVRPNQTKMDHLLQAGLTPPEARRKVWSMLLLATSIVMSKQTFTINSDTEAPGLGFAKNYNAAI